MFPLTAGWQVVSCIDRMLCVTHTKHAHDVLPFSNLELYGVASLLQSILLRTIDLSGSIIHDIRYVDEVLQALQWYTLS